MYWKCIPIVYAKKFILRYVFFFFKENHINLIYDLITLMFSMTKNLADYKSGNNLNLSTIWNTDSVQKHDMSKVFFLQVLIVQ